MTEQPNPNPEQPNPKARERWLEAAARRAHEINLPLPLHPVERAAASGMFAKGYSAEEAVDKIAAARAQVLGEDLPGATGITKDQVTGSGEG